MCVEGGGGGVRHKYQHDTEQIEKTEKEKLTH